jgi:Insertion element 4 transposase N-terminal
VAGSGALTDWISLGVLASGVSRDAVDDAIAETGRGALQARLMPSPKLVPLVLPMLSAGPGSADRQADGVAVAGPAGADRAVLREGFRDRAADGGRRRGRRLAGRWSASGGSGSCRTGWTGWRTRPGPGAVEDHR